MNRGFSYYFRNGMSLAAHALKGESFAKRFSLLVYFLMSALGKILIFTRPIFAIADMNLTNMVKECKSFSFAKIFQNTTDGRRYKNLLLFYFIVDTVLLTGIILIMLPAIILMIIVGLCNLGPNDLDYFIIFYTVFALTIGLGIVALAFVINVILTYVPSGYIAASTRKLDVSDYLYNCKKGMYKMKWTHFLIQFVYSLIIAAILALIGGSVACLLLFAETYLGLALAFVIIMASIILFAYIVQVFFLASCESSYLIYQSATPLDHIVVVAETMDETETVQSVLEEEGDPFDEEEPKED